METIVEKDSPVLAYILLALLFMIVLGTGLGLAYIGGVFTGKNDVIANDNRIASQALLKSAPASVPVPAKP